MPFQFHRSFGATASPPAPRLGPSFSRRRASSTTTSTGVMWVRILQAFSREYQPPGRDSLSGSTKRWIGTTACVPPGKCAVIIRRWSGGTRKRSVVGPPVVVVIHSAFWCAATAHRATTRGRSRFRRAHLICFIRELPESPPSEPSSRGFYTYSILGLGLS